MTFGLPYHADHREPNEVFADLGAFVAKWCRFEGNRSRYRRGIGLENVNAGARFDQLTCGPGCVPASNNQLISTPIIGLRSPIAFGSHALRINGVISRLQ